MNTFTKAALVTLIAFTVLTAAIVIETLTNQDVTIAYNLSEAQSVYLPGTSGNGFSVSNQTAYPDPGSVFVEANVSVADKGYHGDITIWQSQFLLVYNNVTYSNQKTELLREDGFGNGQLTDKNVLQGLLLFQLPSNVVLQKVSLDYQQYSSASFRIGYNRT